MYQTKQEAIKALADVQLEIENLLEEGVWIDEEDKEFIRDIEAVGQLLGFALNDISDAICRINTTSETYLDNQQYISWQIMQAKELISVFHILQDQIA